MTNEELTELREAFNAYTASEGCGCCGNEKRHDAARERMNAILWPKQPTLETAVDADEQRRRNLEWDRQREQIAPGSKMNRLPE